MLFLQHFPAPPLSTFVEQIWFYEGAIRPHAKERILPRGGTSLIVNLHEDQIPIYDTANPDRFRTIRGIAVAGPHSEYFVIDTACQRAVLGVEFRPDGAVPFLRMPASEVHQTHTGLEDLWGASAPRLRDRLVEAPTPERKMQIMESVLLEEAPRLVAPHRAVSFAVERMQTAPHMQTMADLTRQIGLSPKRFIHLFREHTGLTPKVFCRIQRFQLAIQQVQCGKSVSWADVALSAGYFDQAHFNHDFRTFAGVSPTAYLALRTEYQNHVAL